jgi:sulfatase maturation enzyme AslB (radical SAM superfamily)
MDQPLWLWIDPTRECGLKCTFCYTKRSHAEEHLTLNHLRTFLDVALGEPDISLQKLNFNWRGDPLMNPEFISLLSEIEERQLTFPVEFHTNAMGLDESVAQELVRVVRRTQIFVSIDGGNATSHDFNRGQGTFRSAMEGLSRLLDARGDRPTPRIGLFQLDLGVPAASYDPTFTALGRRVDEWVRIHPIHPRSGRRIRPHAPTGEAADCLEEPDDISPDERWWARDVPVGDAKPQGPCFWAGNALFIAPNGDVSVCLLSHTPDGILGNLLVDPLQDLLIRARDFRTKLQVLGRSAVHHCTSCRVAPGEPRPLLDPRPMGS